MLLAPSLHSVGVFHFAFVTSCADLMLFLQTMHLSPEQPWLVSTEGILKPYFYFPWSTMKA
jgi:hypothetical protein